MNERDEMECEVLRVQHAGLLWDLPLMSNEQVPLALGISQTSWQLLKRAGAAPPCVTIAGRVLYRTVDLQQWLLDMAAKKNPGEETGVSGERCDV